MSLQRDLNHSMSQYTQLVTNKMHRIWSSVWHCDSNHQAFTSALPCTFTHNGDSMHAHQHSNHSSWNWTTFVRFAGARRPNPPKSPSNRWPTNLSTICTQFGAQKRRPLPNNPPKHEQVALEINKTTKKKVSLKFKWKIWVVLHFLWKTRWNFTWPHFLEGLGSGGADPPSKSSKTWKFLQVFSILYTNSCEKVQILGGLLRLKLC